jgi:Na+-transporting NADH:ubiquinone oxidoreductase subunit F
VLSEVAVAVVLYVAIVMALVALMVLARKTLIPSGDVRLRVNGQRDVVVRRGGKLLAALTGHEILLPSACGGVGTCGQCRVCVLRGGGGVLPTERALLQPRAVRAGWRLACQVAVKGDMEIEVPGELLEARRSVCRVRSTRNVATFIKELVLELPAGETLAFRAGGYVQTECPPHTLRYQDFDIEPEYRLDWDAAQMWRHVSVVKEPVRRAYSMANHPGEHPGERPEQTNIIMLDVRIAPPPPHAPEGTPPGKMSSYLFSLRPGDRLTVSGPYGEFFAREGEAEMLFIGGGAGMAPMRSIIFDQLERLGAKRKISFWYGARSLREAFYQEDFDRLQAQHGNFRWTLALSEPRLEDGWSGPTGFIHQVVFDRYLGDHPAPEDVEYYLCGPPVMAHAVVAMLDDLGVPPENIFFDDFGS